MNLIRTQHLELAHDHAPRWASLARGPGWWMILVLLLSPLMGTASAASLTDLPSDYDLSARVQSPSGQGTALLSFDTHPEGGYRLFMDGKSLKLVRWAGKTEQLLGFCKVALLANTTTDPLKLTIQRRSGRIAVLAGSRILLKVEDSLFMGGSGDATAGGDATLSKVRVQPIETLVFDDDFMRQPKEQGDWTYDVGSWQIQTVGIVERGANPFSLESSPDPRALASAGEPFWSDYTFKAAAKGSPNTTLGICADLQDAHNYYLLRWSAGTDGALELVRIQDDIPVILARREGGFVPGQWYQLGLRTTGGRLVAEVDHQPLFSVEDTTFGEGKIGLVSDGAKGQTVWFDSVEVRATNAVYDDFGPGEIHRWEDVSDKALAGPPTWKNYTVKAAVVGSGHLDGIPFHYQDDRNYSVFAWNAKESFVIQVADGVRSELASSTVGIPARATRLVEVGAEDGYIWAAIDGRKVLEGLEKTPSSGMAGYQPASAAGRVFRSISIETPPPPDPTDDVTKEFQDSSHHPEMQRWAGRLAAWEPLEPDGPKVYWHKGSLFGDTALHIPLNTKDKASGRFSVALNADGKHLNSGYEFQCDLSPDGLSLQLFRQGEKVAEGRASMPDGQDPVKLNVYRRGSYVYAGTTGAPAVIYRDPAPLDGYSLAVPLGYGGDSSGLSRLGVTVRKGDPIDVSGIQVNNRNVYAETFHLAPVNWRPQSGTWQVSSRWSCQPGWTWYAGKDSGYATNWNKRPLWGDQSINYYAAVMMEATPDSGRETWRDLNCSFCADGVNLFSGYTLVVAGWNGEATRLFRKGRMVAENKDFHFPPSNTAHRLWYDIAIMKAGGRIQVRISTIDQSNNAQNVKLLEWTDPEPLEGGFTGFWTYDNGMVLARAVLSSQGWGHEPVYAADPVWLAQEPPKAPYPGADQAGAAARDLMPGTGVLLAELSPWNPEPAMALPVTHIASNPSNTREESPVFSGKHSTLKAASGHRTRHNDEKPSPVHTPGHTSSEMASAHRAEQAGGAFAAASPITHGADQASPAAAAEGPVVLLNPAPGLLGFAPGYRANPTPEVTTAAAHETTAVAVADIHTGQAGFLTQPTQVTGQGIRMTVEPDGRVTHIQYRGREVISELLLDVRSSEWHQIKLAADTTKVRIMPGDRFQVVIEFQIHDNDSGIVLTGRERLRVIADGSLRVEAVVDPTSSFQSNRISLNVVVPASDYEGQKLMARSAGVQKTLAVSGDPVYPIQLATAIQNLALPPSGITIHPLSGSGVLEDLRHYHLDEFWYEQQADYAYPKVKNGAHRYFGMDIHFGTPGQIG